MTTPENPERLWAAKYRDEDGFEYVTVFERPEDAEGSHCHGTDAEVQAYVREDVASDEARLFRDQRNVLASKLATAEDDARLFRDQRNVLASRLATAEDEATALRRERDALREHLRTVLLAFEEETSQGDGIREEHAPGYEAAKAAAGKGVG